MMMGKRYWPVRGLLQQEDETDVLKKKRRRRSAYFRLIAHQRDVVDVSFFAAEWNEAFFCTMEGGVSFVSCVCIMPVFHGVVVHHTEKIMTFLSFDVSTFGATLSVLFFEVFFTPFLSLFFSSSPQFIVTPRMIPEMTPIMTTDRMIQRTIRCPLQQPAPSDPEVIIPLPDVVYMLRSSGEHSCLP